MSKKITIIVLSIIVITIIVKRKKMDKNTDTAGTYPNPSGKNKGLRNNNPLNIRKNNDVFQGEIIPSGDKAYKQFRSMAYGYRAAMVIIRNYIKNGYNTIAKIVTRWAPPSDGNNTISYINHVEQRSGIGRTVPITTKSQLLAVVRAMSISECSYKPTDVELNTAYNLI